MGGSGLRVSEDRAGLIVCTVSMREAERLSDDSSDQCEVAGEQPASVFVWVKKKQL